MSKILLISPKNSLRSVFFHKAANELNIKVEEIVYSQIYDYNFEDCFVKIEPQNYESNDVAEINNLVKSYTEKLNYLNSKAGVRFLNPVSSILACLNKRKCKEILSRNKVNVTPEIKIETTEFETFIDILQTNKHLQIFIKPDLGSGAAGVVALRLGGNISKFFAYSSIKIENVKLLNSSKINTYSDISSIKFLVNEILKQGAIIENWIPKASYKELAYDLRVVYQFGQIEYIVVRQSKGPITNLHMNNKALNINDLELPAEIFSEIQNLCKKAMNCFPEMNYAGIDILLQKNTLKPYIIEINGQGDEIYNDMYAENKIYKEQLRYMKKNCL